MAERAAPAEVSRATVLAGLNGGCRTVWDLASRLGVPAHDPDLHRVVLDLIAGKEVAASSPDLYSVQLRVVP